MIISEVNNIGGSFLYVEDFTIGPYVKAIEHYNLFFEHVWYSDTSLSEKTLKGIKHLALGLIFSIPLVNTIAMIGYAVLSKQCEPVVHINGTAVPSNEIKPLKIERSESDKPSELSVSWSEVQKEQSIIDANEKITESSIFISNLVNSSELADHSLMLSHASDLHQVHAHLTKLSKYFGQTKKDSTSWLKFLDNLEKVRFHFPSHTVHLLDLTSERFSFNNPHHCYDLTLTSANSLSKKELSEFVAIGKESFTIPLSKREIRAFVKRSDTTTILAKNNDRVVGFVMCKRGTITYIARKADAIMGVGTALFQKLKKELEASPIQKIKLQVRKGNKAAISLYEKVGFTTEKPLKNFYSYPTEDGLLMTCEKII